MKKVIVLILLSVIPLFLYAQDDSDSRDLYKDTVGVDIETSSFHDLSDWCSRLNLPTEGSSDELRQRLYSFYGVSPTAAEKNGQDKKLISIEKAENLDYFTIEKIDENYASISGDVFLKLKDQEKNETHIIQADTILFNFEENTITASGNIRYTLEGETKTENFRGDKLTFNIDSTAGLFDKGITEQEKTVNKGNEDEQEIIFYFKGDLINKTEENYVVLENGEITSCDFDDPHFKIRAKKLWLITSNEWAILNGLVHVGRVPIFYFPAFIYGGDDIFFNPVFGYMDDFGAYLQTTTYLIGRKSEDPDTAFSFMQTDSEFNYQKREGLYLTKDPDPTEEQKALQDYSRDTDNYLKIILDYYSNLGMYAALDLKLSKPAEKSEKAFPGFVNSLFTVFTKNELYVSAARTRKIEDTGNFYSALFPDDSGVYSSRWQKSSFITNEIPFRYGFDYSTGVDLSWVDLNLSMNMYSDRDYRLDFSNRNENLDLLSFMNNADEDESTGTEITGCKWDAALKITPQLEVLKPYVNQFNLNAETALNFSSKLLESTDEKYDDYIDYFFYPDSFDLPVSSLSVAGTLLPVKPRTPSVEEDDDEIESEIKLRPPWGDSADSENEKQPPMGIPEPAPDIEIETGTFWTDTDFFQNKLSYSFTPKYSNRTQLGTTEWETPDDILFDNIDYAFRSADLTGRLVYNANFFENLLDIDNTLSADLDFNEHYNMELLEIETAEKYLDEDRQANDAQVKNNLVVSTTPLVFLDFFDKTKITYNFNSILYRYDYSIDEAGFLTEFFKADDEFISEHKIGFEFPTSLGDFSQTLNITTNLPPVQMKASGSYRLDYRISSTQLNTSVSETDDGYEFEPLTFNEKITLGDSSLTNNISYNYADKYFEKNTTDLKISLLDGNMISSANMVYDINNKVIENLSWDLGLWFVKYSLTAKNTYDYLFNPESGWVQSEDKQFLPYSMQFSIIEDTEDIYFWKNRIKLDFNINSALNMNLRQFTESNLTFKIGFDLEIYKFLNLSFESSSINRAVYRYFPDYCSKTGMNIINPVTDLLKSFNFTDINDRYESNFNLQTIKVGLNHDMHDWDLNLTYSGSPFINEEGDYPKWDWENSLNIFLKWKSIPDIKTEAEIDNEGVSF